MSYVLELKCDTKYWLHASVLQLKNFFGARQCELVLMHYGYTPILYLYTIPLVIFIHTHTRDHEALKSHVHVIPQ